MRVDFHTHFYPAQYIDLMLRLGRDDFRRVQPQDPDLSQRVEDQDTAGVDAQVLSFIGVNSVVGDPGGATEAAQLLNTIYADVATRYPGRFLSFAMLPLPHVDRAIAEVQRALALPTCIGVGLPTSISGTPLDDPSFDDLWAELDARAAIAFIHPVGGDSREHWGMGDFGLGAMFGSPMQIGLAATRLVFSGVTSRYPHVRFVFAQGGGFLAARWEAIENIVLRPGFAGHAPYALGWVNDLAIDRDDPMGGFRNFLFDTAGVHQMPSMLLTARESYGVDRLLLGSDTAFGSIVDVVDCVKQTDRLDDAERASVLDRWGEELGSGHGTAASTPTT